MPKILTGLELSVVVNELAGLSGTKINKIYQPDSHTLLLNLFRAGGTKYNLKIDSGVGIYLTSYDIDMPQLPPSFCMFLRKYLNNSRLLSISQKGLERIIEIHFETKNGKRILICELFSKGNFIITDEKYIILNVAAIQKWKSRVIKKGETYIYPPSNSLNLFSLNEILFEQVLAACKNQDIVRTLAIQFGLGGIYSEEVCLNSKVNKEKTCDSLNSDDKRAIFESLRALIIKFRNSSKSEVIYKESNPYDATPFHLNLYNKMKTKSTNNFSQALDILYTSGTISKLYSERNKLFQQKLDKLKIIYDSQKSALDDYKREYKKNRRFAEEIYNNYQLISKTIKKIKIAQEAGYSWYEIQDVLSREKREGVYEATIVREIIPEDNKIILNILDGLVINLHKSLEENASDYYDRAKEFKYKLSGAEKTVARVEDDIAKLYKMKSKSEMDIAVRIPKIKEKIKKEWYEKFHWFFTSNGLLAVGGKDATSNEIVVKKHTDIGDYIFHTNIAGSPFFVLKNARDKAKDEDLKETAVATASYSRAWKDGLTVTDVFWVRPEQVSKKAQAGEYLAKGSFMIRGKRNYFRNTELLISVGLDKKGNIISGPKSAVIKKTAKYITIKPGGNKKSDTAKKIAHMLKCEDKLDLIMSAMPAGNSMVY